MAAADIHLLDELGELIEDLTTTGRPSLDEKAMKKVKNICKTSEMYVRHVYHLIMTQLKKDHSEIRLSAFQVIDQLFTRSHVFRDLLLEEFQVFLELTVESDFSQRLPPPKNTADTLKRTALEAVEKWNQKFGNHYKKLALGHSYLTRIKHIEFDTMRSRSVAERQQLEERNMRRRSHLIQQLAKVENQIKEMEGEIKLCLTEMENCFKLLLPHPDQYEVYSIANNKDVDSNTKEGNVNNTHDVNFTSYPEKAECDDNSQHVNVDDQINHHDDCDKLEGQCEEKNSHDEEMKTRYEVQVSLNNESADSTVVADHGLGTRSYALSIDVNTEGPEIRETPDNSVVIATLQEMNKELTYKFLPMTNKWLAVLAKGENTQQKIHQVIDLKQAMEAVKDKFAEIKLLPLQQTDDPKVGAEDSSGDEFEDVPEKEGLELVIPAELRQEYGLEPISNTTSTSTLACKGASKGKETSQQSQQDLLGAKDTVWDPAASTRDMLKYRRAFRANQQLSSTATSTSTSSSCTEHEGVRKKRLEQAPVVPFDVDLLFWEDPSGGAPSVIKHDSIHRFYGSKDNADEEFTPDLVKGQVRNRFMTFAGKFEPVKWACRAPLPNGKLCPRRDRIKCPFHGRIVPRDEQGERSDQPKPTTQNEGPSSSSDATAANQPEWQEIQSEIEAATGLDLGGHTKRKRHSKSSTSEKKLSKKAKYARLTNLKKHDNTPRNRLEKKVLSEKAVRRVANQVESISRKINRSRFAHQFNYAFQQ